MSNKVYILIVTFNATKWLSRTLSFISEKFQLRQFATATVSTQIFVLPLLLYMTGELSLVALPVNLLILVVIPLTMLFGFVAGTVGLLSQLVALPFAFVAYSLLTYELWIVELFSSFAFASIQTPSIGILGVLLIYVVYAMVLVRKKAFA